MDDHEAPETDRAVCPECRGTGSLAVLQGDGENVERCWSCNGHGVQQTRDELVNETVVTEAIA